MESPDREIRRIARHLHLEVDDRLLDEYCRDFLSQELRNTKFSLEDTASQKSIDPLVGEVYRNLLDLACDQRCLSNKEVSAMFCQWNQAYETKTALLGLVGRLLVDHD